MLPFLSPGIVAAPPAQANAGTLTVHADRPLHRMPKGFYGLMTEEINHAYDGGLYGELVQNRALMDAAGPAHWTLLGNGARMSMEGERVDGTALTRALTVEPGPFGGAGVANDGFWGIPVRPDTTYRLSFYLQGGSATHGPMEASLETADGRTVWAKVRAESVEGPWRKVEMTLRTRADAPSSTANRLAIRAVGKGFFRIAGVSLFGPTFKHRPNGLRPDLMALMGDMKPTFLRLPGGNYLEGDRIEDRFDWKATLGRVEDRKGHMAPWSYRSSDGLGLMEFLLWCEDLKMKPLLAVFAGYALRGAHVEPGPALKPFVDDALDEIEFVVGDPKTTKWGAERARRGHPRPFPLEYVEIGNEDWFDRSGSYEGRFAQFFDAIKAKYPKLQLIASAGVKSRVPDVLDDHYYRTAAEMARDSAHYRTADRKGPKIFVGEWASLQGQPTPDFQAALGDAAWLTGLERDSDLVVMEAYAPLFTNVNPGASQWNTNLIGYDALRSFGSPGYWVQALFAQNQGETVLPVDVTATKPNEAFAYRGGVGLAGAGAEYVDPKAAGKTLPTIMDWTYRGGSGMTVDADQPDGRSAVTLQGRNPVLTAGDPEWTDLDFTVLARKPAGTRGVSLRFHALDDHNFWQWNVGGTTNEIRHQEIFASRVVKSGEPMAVQENGGYTTLRLEVKGGHVRGYVDGKLAIEADENPPAIPTVYATASRTGKETILKVVNLSATAAPMRLELPGAGSRFDVSGSMMTGPLGGYNTLDEPKKIAPRPLPKSTLRAGDTYAFAPYSVTVLRLSAK